MTAVPTSFPATPVEELTVAAFHLEEALCGERWPLVAALMYDALRHGSEHGGTGANLASLLEQTAFALRIHDADFDEYVAARANVDSEFEKRLLAVLPGLATDHEPVQ